MSKHLFTVVLFSLLIAVGIYQTGCSSSRIKELSGLELAQQLVINQQQSDQPQPQTAPFKVHFIQAQKAVIDKPLEIELEIVPQQSWSAVQLVVEASDGLEFKPRWLFLEQPFISRRLPDVKQDQIYRQTLSVIPNGEGLHQLKVYVLYPGNNNEQGVDLHSFDIAIGDSVGKERDMRIKL